LADPAIAHRQRRVEVETVRFNLINPQTNNRIKMKTVDAGTGDEVARGDLVKGFQIAKNEYVLLDKEDIASVKLESTKIIDIEKFVPRESIDRLYWDTPYHRVPDGKTGIEVFAVIREAMCNGDELTRHLWMSIGVHGVLRRVPFR
jgi:DNA end-binding protein Ku